MIDEKRNINWGLIFGFIGFVISCVNGGMIFGKLQGQVERNTESIKEIENVSRDAAGIMNAIDQRTVRMETKLEILLPSSAIKDVNSKR